MSKTPFSATDHRFMERALALAEQGWGTTHPNPMVGAVIVEDGKIVAEGWHARAGEAHAEKAALTALGRAPSARATMYVTLEPCSTPGRTGACTSAIKAAGIREVVVATDDPNPAHAGRAYTILQEAGIRVRHGLLANRARQLNRIFNHWIEASLPYIAVKLALTLDGKFATRTGHARWVTGPEARADVMRWRRLFPAIMVGPGTVLADNPQLTSRTDTGTCCPVRIVLDRTLRTVDSTAHLPQIYTDEHRAQTRVFCQWEADPQRVQQLHDRGVKVTMLDGSLDETGFLQAVAVSCAAEGITGILVEPGPGLLRSLLAADFIHLGIIYTAPKFIADEKAPGVLGSRLPLKMEDALQLDDVEHAIFGQDIRTCGTFPSATKPPSQNAP